MESRESVPTPYELWELFLRYVRQNLVDPLRGAGRFIAFGVLGSIHLAVGLGLVTLGLLRGLQSVPLFQQGGWSSVPYLGAALGVVVVVAMVVARIPRDSLHRGPR